jgi:hypothetical protein
MTIGEFFALAFALLLFVFHVALSVTFIWFYYLIAAYCFGW